MVGRLPAASLVLALVAAWLWLFAPSAHAACHIAAFVESEVEGAESTGGVSLVVELQGRVGSCAGTVDVATVDGTAVAGEDYEALSQTLSFEENDDRVETVDLTILTDDEPDGGETFTVELSDPTGDISGTGGAATVTITDDSGGADEPEDGGDEPTGPAADETAEDASEDADAAGADDGQDSEDGSGDIGIIIAVVVASAIGVAAFALLRGRA